MKNIRVFPQISEFLLSYELPTRSLRKNLWTKHMVYANFSRF